MNKIYPQAPVPVTCAGIQRPKCSNKPNGVGTHDLYYRNRPNGNIWCGYTATKHNKIPSGKGANDLNHHSRPSASI